MKFSAHINFSQQLVEKKKQKQRTLRRSAGFETERSENNSCCQLLLGEKVTLKENIENGPDWEM
jgi:hypothetical protein